MPIRIQSELPAKEITGNVVTQKVFITPDQQKAVEEHINEVIAESVDFEEKK